MHQQTLNNKTQVIVNSKGENEDTDNEITY